jgi:Uma2 family endonuclease
MITTKVFEKEGKIFLSDEEKFPYGWRYKAKTTPDGQTIYHRSPLAITDFLDPQVGDQMIQRRRHAQISIDIYNMLDNRYLNDKTVGVFFDLKVVWDLPNLKEPAPDVMVVPHLKNKEADRSRFDVAQEGTRPSLIVEVMSPHYPGDDTLKVEIYEQAGIAEYIIVNPYTGQNLDECHLSGYRLIESKYQPILPDAQGQLLSETIGVWFGVDEKLWEVILTDAATGERLLTARETQKALKQAEMRLAELEARLQQLEANQKDE